MDLLYSRAGVLQGTLEGTVVDGKSTIKRDLYFAMEEVIAAISNVIVSVPLERFYARG